MKKLTALILSLLMLFLLAGCGAEDNTNKALLSHFTTQTLDGDEVTEDIFSTRVTMLNVWATFCGPCINEMPDLQRLSEDYKDKDFQIVGAISDVCQTKGYYSQSSISAAQKIVEATGVEYINILGSQELLSSKAFRVFTVPTTYFLDDEGEIIAGPYEGSLSYEEWALLIDSVLEIS